MPDRIDQIAEDLVALTADVNGLRDQVDKRFAEFEEKIVTKVAGIVRIEHEQTREMLQRAAEGYAATLERIDRDAAEYKRQTDAHLAMHDRALRNHAERIAALEGVKNGE